MSYIESRRRRRRVDSQVRTAGRRMRARRKSTETVGVAVLPLRASGSGSEGLSPPRPHRGPCARAVRFAQLSGAPGSGSLARLFPDLLQHLFPSAPSPTTIIIINTTFTTNSAASLTLFECIVVAASCQPPRARRLPISLPHNHSSCGLPEATRCAIHVDRRHA